MPYPVSPGTILRNDLGIVIEEYSETLARDEYCGPKIMPWFNSAHDNGKWPVISLAEMLRKLDTKRAIGAEYVQDDWTFTFDSFQTEEDGAVSPVFDEESKMYAHYFDAERMASERAASLLLRSHEVDVAKTVHDTANVGSTIEVDTPWSDPSSDPKNDIVNAKRLMLKGDGGDNAGYGIRPNSILMTDDLFEAVLANTKLNERVSFTTTTHVLGTDEQRRQLVSAYFGVDVIVAKSILNTSAKGSEHDLKSIWPSETALLMKISNGGPDMREPALGRTILWTGDSPSKITMEQYYDNALRKMLFRARHHTCIKVTYKGALCHIKGVMG